MENYLISIVTFGAFYALLALGLNLIWGMTGMINLGLAGFFALGAYASALATTGAALPIVLGPGGRVRGRRRRRCPADPDNAEAARRLSRHRHAWLLRGCAPGGQQRDLADQWYRRRLRNSRPVPLQPDAGAFNLLFCVLALAVVAAVLILAQRLRHSPYGRVLRAIRDDELVAAVAGKSVRRFKIEAFAVGAGIMGLAGGLYGHYTSYIAPDIFRPLVTIYIFLALTAGGTGNNLGAVVGAFLVMAILEGTRFIGDIVPDLPGAQIAALREILVGTLLILVMRFRPAGLIPERAAIRGGAP